MGEQVQFKKVDLPKLDTKPTFTIPTFTSKAPEIKLDGGSNWGVGDEVSFSGGGSVDELSDAQNATDSDDIAVVRQGLTDSQNVEQSPENTGVVINAGTMVDNGEGRVATDQAGVVEAEGELQEAEGTEEVAEADGTQNQEKVSSQQQVVNQKTEAVESAKQAEGIAKCNLDSANATYTRATNAREIAENNYNNAAPEQKAAALAALNVAKQAEQVAKEKKELAEAQLQEATKQRELAEAEKEKAEAELKNDKEALENAEKKVAEAQNAVQTAQNTVEQKQEILNNSQAELDRLKTDYEKVKGDVKNQSAELSAELEQVLEELEKGEKSDGKKDNNNWFTKGQNAMNFFNQGMNGFQSLAGAAASNTADEEEGTSKRSLTAQEKANIYAFTANLERSLNNGFGQIDHTGRMISDLNNNSTVSNPFMKKKTEA